MTTRQPRLGHWHVSARISRDWTRNDPFTRRVRIAVIKKTADAPELTYPRHGQHYKGFVFELLFWLPLAVGQWR